MNTKLRQAWPTPSNPQPIILFGAGGIVRDAHLPAYAKAGFTVAGVCDPEPGKAAELAQQHSIATVYVNAAAAIAACGTDVVYDIAVPPHVLPELVTQLPDGAAVLMQKPMGSDLAQARQIRTTCQDKQLKAAVNFQLKFAPMMLAVKDAIEQGLLGELLEIEVRVNCFTPWHLFPFLVPMERVEIAVHSIHYLDTIRAFAGNPRSVFARSMRDPRVPELAQTRTSAILDYGEDLRVLMTLNHNHQCGRKFQDAWFRIEGTTGTMMVKLGLLYDYPNGESDELWLCTDGKEWEQIPLEGSWFVDAFIGTMSNVQRFAAGEDDNLYAGYEDAFHTMALVEACFDSLSNPGVKLES